MSQPLWSEMDKEARRAACLKGRKAGLSASQIAKPLGCTRMAVIGMLKRMKDAGTHVPASPHGPGSNQGHKKSARTGLPIVPEKVPAAPKKTKVHPPGVVSAVRARMFPSENRPAPQSERTFFGEPVSRNLSLMELSDAVCRYPHGDPKASDFGFCGASTKGALGMPVPPYCSYHARLVFQPLDRRARADRIATATVRKAA